MPNRRVGYFIPIWTVTSQVYFQKIFLFEIQLNYVIKLKCNWSAVQISLIAKYHSYKKGGTEEQIGQLKEIV